MATTSHGGGVCDKCGAIKPEFWIEIGTNQIGDQPKKEIWCIDCIRGGKNNKQQETL